MASESRLAWLDVTRWVALIAMFVAHAAPPAGPLDQLLRLGDYLALALFATTMGAGAQLGAYAAEPTASGRRLAGWAAAAVTRGALLVALGVLANQFDALVVNVLFHLGALAVVAPMLVIAPTRWLAGIGVAALLLTPWLKDVLSGPMRRAAAGDDVLVAHVLDIAGGGDYYRLPSLIAWAALGALVVRWWRSPTYAPHRAAGVAVGAGGVSMALLGLHAVEVVDIPPYSGSHLQVVLCGLLCLVVMIAALVMMRDGVAWARPLAIAGAMALTLYVAQHAFLGWWTRDGASDDSWITLSVLTIGGTGLAVAWRAVPMPGILRRGLLDGPVSWLSAQVRALVAR